MKTIYPIARQCARQYWRIANRRTRSGYRQSKEREDPAEISRVLAVSLMLQIEVRTVNCPVSYPLSEMPFSGRVTHSPFLTSRELSEFRRDRCMPPRYASGA